MRCPKCQYLGFEGQGRCRNCGYDLSLSETPIGESESGPEPTAPGEIGSGGDLPLRTEPTARERARAAIRQRAANRTPSAESFDLPLFSGAPEPPRVTPPAPSPTPRAPLSVRRATVEPPHLRGTGTPAPLGPGARRPSDTAGDLELQPRPDVVGAPEIEDRLSFGSADTLDAGTVDVVPADLDRPAMLDTEVEEAVLPPARESGPPSPDVADAATEEADDRLAPIGARITSGLVDVALLAGIDAVVVTFTLRLTELAWSDIGRLPLAPLLAFLALLATGYLSMFTLLAGQTVGQMVAGTRVVASGGGAVRLGHAVLRAVLQVLTVPLAGLGFLPALLGSERRALYDRLSESEVVRDVS